MKVFRLLHSRHPPRAHVLEEQHPAASAHPAALPALRERGRPEWPAGPSRLLPAFGLESGPVSSLPGVQLLGFPGRLPALPATSQWDSGPPRTPAGAPVPSLMGW